MKPGATKSDAMKSGATKSGRAAAHVAHGADMNTRAHRRAFVAGVPLVWALARVASTEPDVACRAPAAFDPAPVSSFALHGPEYYQFPLVSTGRVPGTGRATGLGEVTFPSSPYGVALATDGSYRYDFTVRFERLAPARTGTYVVWTTTPELDQVALAGELSDPAGFQGRVDWNKFLVVVTLEPAFDPTATIWSGPIVMRGMSRSGMMHTMAGHGAFEEEKCAAYGYE